MHTVHHPLERPDQHSHEQGSDTAHDHEDHKVIAGRHRAPVSSEDLGELLGHRGGQEPAARLPALKRR